MIVVCAGPAVTGAANDTASAAHRFTRLIVGHLLDRAPAAEVAVVVDAPEWAWDLSGPGVEARIRDFADLGVEVRPGDADDLAFMLGEAFVGADRVLLHPGRHGPGSEPHSSGPMEVGYRWIEAASGVLATAGLPAGAGRIVYSGAHGGAHRINETHLKWTGEQLGVAWTVLRHGLHSEALLPAIELALASGELVSGLGDALVAPAAQTDYAEAAAMVLSEDGHDGRTYDLTGTPALKPPGIAALASRIAGCEVPLREVGPPALREELRRAYRRAYGPDVGDHRADDLYRLYAVAQSGVWSTATPTLGELVGTGTLTVEAALRAGLDRADGAPLPASYPFPSSSGGWGLPPLPPGW